MSWRQRPRAARRLSYHRKLNLEALEDRRVLAAGVLDPSFDGDGKVTTNKFFNATDRNEEARGVAVQSNGRIVVAGFAANSSGNNDFALARYNSSGSLDTTFGTAGTGKVTTAIGSSDDEIYGITLQSDDKIVVVGRTKNSGGDYDIVVARYTANGVLDTTFNSTGKLTTSLSATNDEAFAVGLLTTGVIVVAGRTQVTGSNYDFFLTRISSTGSLQGTTTTGTFTGVTDQDDEATSLVVAGDNSIFVGGLTFSNTTNTYDFALAKYTSTGFLSGTFGAGGKTTANFPGVSEDLAYAVALQADGKILVGGHTRSTASGPLDFALARFQTNGTLDAAFGAGGLAVTDMGGIDDEIRSIVVLPSTEMDRIVVGGFSNGDFALARYNRPDGTLDAGFGAGGKTLTSFGTLDDRAYDIVRQPDGKIVAAGFTTVNAGNRDFAVARYFGPDQPEVTVVGASTDIIDGDSTPSTLEGTDFGTVNQGTPGVTRSYTVRNDGSATLTLSGLSVPAGFAVVDGLPASLAPGATDTLIIQLNTTTTGTRAGDVSFSTNDPDEGTFNFRIQGTVAVVSGPEVTVLGNSINIIDGDTTPSTADGTDYGSVTIGDPVVVRSFTIRNDGNSMLTLSGLTVPSGFAVTDGLAASLGPGSSDIITVQMATGTAGTLSGDISFTTNDADEGTFNFRIQGAVNATIGPEVTVLGNSISIADGDSTPTTTDGTDYGTVAVGGAAISHSFTIRNDGNATLIMSGLSVPAGFTVTDGLAASLAPGASDTLTVRLDTAVSGTRTGDISFTTNDADEGTFNFAITGFVNGVSGPEVTVLGNSVSIADGDSTPSSADDTYFGSVTQGAPFVSHTFTVRNDGTATLTTSFLSVPLGFTITETLSASIAAGSSDTFTVQFDTSAVGTKAGDVSFSTNDPNEGAFNFRIEGIVNPVNTPDAAVLGNGISILDGDTTPGTADGTDFGTIAPGGAAVSHNFIVRNDGTATLTMGTLTVPTGYTVTDGLATSLAPGATDTITIRLDATTAGVKSGQVSFTTNTAENPFNFSITGTVNALGDYNRDAAIGAADYVVWRKTLGRTGITPFSGADGSGNGSIGPEDYTIWRSNFGATGGAGAGASVEGGGRSVEGAESGVGQSLAVSGGSLGESLAAASTKDATTAATTQKSHAVTMSAPLVSQSSTTMRSQGSRSVNITAYKSRRDDALLAWVSSRWGNGRTGDDAMGEWDGTSGENSIDEAIGSLETTFAGCRSLIED